MNQTDRPDGIGVSDRAGLEVRRPRAGGGLGALGILGLAGWLGLIAGFAEVATFLLVRARSGEVWPYFGKVRQYPWTIPLVDAALLVAIALPLALMSRRWPAIGRSVAPTLLVALAFMPMLLVPGSKLYAGSLFVLALGIASLVVPPARERPWLVARVVRVSLPALLVGLLAPIAWRAVPAGGPPKAAPAGGPNVLLIVLDTVRADHLSLPGAGSRRDTSPNLARFARRGAVFTGARATAPWTLPSHASLMTGAWDFEVVEGRYGTLDPGHETLAGVLGSRGYETAGIVANLFFCPYFTGLDRGFAHYRDIPLTPATILASSEIGGRLLDALGRLETRWTDRPPEAFRRLPRIDAAEVNRRFADWLDRRADPDRPFFAFLNYFDAHDPYIVPEGAEHRFGSPPATPDELKLLHHWWLYPDKPGLSSARRRLAIDGYDSCIAALDAQLGRLFDDLERRGLLDETVVVITSDHGEAFGEHGLYGHGGSLYEDQLHVPLVVVAPGIVPEGLVLDDVVSLRDLPATILDLAGVAGAPLPGSSLAGLWGEARRADPDEPSPAVAAVAEPENFNPNEGRSPVFLGPMIAVIDRDRIKYIRTRTETGDREEVYDLAADPGESTNLAPALGEEGIAPLRRLLDEAIGRVADDEP